MVAAEQWDNRVQRRGEGDEGVVEERRRLLGNFKQPEPLLATGTLFSSLFAMARAIWAPTPRQGHRPRVTLGMGAAGWGGMWGAGGRGGFPYVATLLGAVGSGAPSPHCLSTVE